MSRKDINKNRAQYKLTDEIDKMLSKPGRNEVSFGVACFRTLPEIEKNKVFCHVHHSTPSLPRNKNKKTSKNSPNSFSLSPSQDETCSQV